MIELITSLLGSFLKPENIEKLVDQGTIKALIEKADKETIRWILIFWLAYLSQDSGVREKAIDMLGGKDEVV